MGVRLLPAVAGVVAAGALYQWIRAAQYRRHLAPPGEMIDVGGHRLHLVCSGEGTPVLFESAVAASSLSWSLVQPAVAGFARACAYDRAGLGWSDEPSSPRTFERILDELDALISHVAGEEPCVLVGHSYGGFLVRAYAAHSPTKVAALVLVDPPIEWLTPTPERARMLKGGQQLATIGAILARMGVVRACLGLLTGGAPAAPRQVAKLFGPTAALTLERLVAEVRKLPPAVHPLVQAHWSQPKCFHAMAGYLRVLAREGAAFAAGVPPREIPVAVISSGEQSPGQLLLHRDLARVADGGVHVTAEHSGHWVQFDEPELVVRVIRRMVEMVRPDRDRSTSAG